MTSQQRIVVNTAAQYTRTIINVCLSLYSTRLILAALGQTDFGIYSIVAGVVAMLSFMTNTLISTTQRFLSYNHGRKDHSKIYEVFGNSVLLHIVIGIVLALILCALEPWLVYDFLNIDDGKRDVASVVYFATMATLFITLLTAPFRALYIARENIVYISVVDVLDGILKVCIAIFLTHITDFDRLAAYAMLLISIAVFNLLAFSIYALARYEECHIPKLSEWNNDYLKQIGHYATWMLYSVGCVIGRTQGVAVIINKFLGSIANAAYGIALQISGAVNFLAVSITNAMSPQIVKSEGAGDRKRMLMLAETSSKFTFLMMALVGIPLIYEMPEILHLWLGDVPENAVMFCRFVLATSICDQMTSGLILANEAVGNIRAYALTINTIKVLTLPAAWLCLLFGLPLVTVMWFYIGFEIICALSRLPFLKSTAGLSISHFAKHVLLRLIIPTLTLVVCSFLITHFMDCKFRFVLTLAIAMAVGAISIWFTALEENERNILRDMLLSKIHLSNKRIAS